LERGHDLPASAFWTRIDGSLRIDREFVTALEAKVRRIDADAAVSLGAWVIGVLLLARVVEEVWITFIPRLDRVMAIITDVPDTLSHKRSIKVETTVTPAG